MSKLKELEKWIIAYEKVNNSDPPIKNIRLKIKDLLKEEVISSKPKPIKIYFRDCRYQDYDTLRTELALDKKFVSEYTGVDLRSYIEEALAWSEKGNLTSEMGWLLTLKNWMRKAKREGRLIMKATTQKKQIGHINY